MLTLIIDETEAQFQRRITDLAEELGWEWMHVGRVGKYVANGAKGTLGTGWPDLTLCRGSRLLFVECKAARGELSITQKLVLGRLSLTGAETYVWRPSDWAFIVEALARA